jgi:hypothetical protein
MRSRIPDPFLGFGVIDLARLSSRGRCGQFLQRRRYGPAAIEELIRLATNAESEAARVAACREILDRAYGRATQPIEGNMKWHQPAAQRPVCGQ